jgi:hypothetical protein
MMARSRSPRLNETLTLFNIIPNHMMQEKHIEGWKWPLALRLQD